GPPYGLHDAGLGAAAAEMRRERRTDLVVARIGRPVEQRLRADDDAGDAVAALRRLLLEEGLLERVQPLGRPDPFERRDLVADESLDRRCARGHRLAVD